MNNYQKLAKLIKENELKSKPFESKGTGGGYDDAYGLVFYKAGTPNVALGKITTNLYGLDKDKEVLRALVELEEAIENLDIIGIDDMDTLKTYLKGDKYPI